MIRDTVYAAGITAASAVSTSITAVKAPITYPLGGVDIPIVPALIGVIATLLVRIMVVTKTRTRNLRAYNVSLTLLTMLGAATYVTDNHLGPGAAFGAGLTCGALGVAMVEVAKSQFFDALKAGGRAMFVALFGTKEP